MCLGFLCNHTIDAHKECPILITTICGSRTLISDLIWTQGLNFEVFTVSWPTLRQSLNFNKLSKNWALSLALTHAQAWQQECCHLGMVFWERVIPSQTSRPVCWNQCGSTTLHNSMLYYNPFCFVITFLFP